MKAAKKLNTVKTKPPPWVSRTSSARGIVIRVKSVTLFSYFCYFFFIVTRDSNAAGFLQNVYEKILDHGDVGGRLRPAAIQGSKIAYACLERAKFGLYGRD